MNYGNNFLCIATDHVTKESANERRLLTLPETFITQSETADKKMDNMSMC